MKKVTKCLWWCAGARTEILENCPTDQAKYFGIGGTILFTALMASFAGGYAFFSAFKQVTEINLPDGTTIEIISASSFVFATFFGLFWGGLIFNLDRYIVCTIKDDGTSKITKEEWLNALPRLIMAVLLGLVISTPLELKLFEKEIKYEIKEIIKENRNTLNDKDLPYVSEKEGYLKQIAKLEQEQRDAITGKSLSPEKIELTNVNDKITELNKQRDIAGTEFKTAQANYNSAYYSCIQNNQGDEEAKKTCSQKTSSLAYTKKLKEKEVNRLDDLIEAAKGNKDAVTSNDIENLKALRSKNKAQIDALQSKIDNVDKKLIDNKLIAEADSKKYGGFMANIEAYSRLKEKHFSLAIVGFFITLLFIFIEVAPVLFKLMTEAGPYDDIIKRIKHEVAVSEKQKISDMNDKINTDILISTEKNKGRLDAELKGNKELLEAIALAQAEIAKKAVEKWKEEELKRLEKSTSHIIQSNIKTSGITFEDKFWMHKKGGEEFTYVFKNGSSNELWLKENIQIIIGKWFKINSSQIEVEINSDKKLYNIEELTETTLRLCESGTSNKLELISV
jgi:hypothetical protein